MGVSYNDNINKIIFFHGCLFDSDRVAFLSQNWNDKKATAKKATGAFVTVANPHIYLNNLWKGVFGI